MLNTCGSQGQGVTSEKPGSLCVIWVPGLVQTAIKSSKIQILGEGYVYMLTQNVQVKLKVCFVPEAQHRLLSTGQLLNTGFTLQANDKKTSITTHNKTYFIGYPDPRISTIHWINTIIQKPIVKCYGATIQNLNYTIWHNRMAHPNLEVM